MTRYGIILPWEPLQAANNMKTEQESYFKSMYLKLYDNQKTY